MSLDTIRSSSDTFTMQSSSIDTTPAKPDTAKLSLPPIARAVVPDRLAAFLPPMLGWTPSGDLQKELQVRDTFNLSRAWQDYTMGSKTMTIQINDFAYVPSLYAPYQKYKGTYLDDNNNERVETTAISGFPSVQTMEKKTPHAEVVVFPGKRFVVVIVEDGENDVNEVRRIAASINLKGLESLQ
ncbi:MAG TPA: hypothetical protein VFD13_06155 [Candidatus Kapabacteria bacterium]|nr:hypothetical protein [Candidatus Kapabacteria bacterium]